MPYSNINSDGEMQKSNNISAGENPVLSVWDLGNPNDEEEHAPVMLHDAVASSDQVLSAHFIPGKEEKTHFVLFDKASMIWTLGFIG